MSVRNIEGVLVIGSSRSGFPATSGILFNRKYVITSGGILSRFRRKNDEILSSGNLQLVEETSSEFEFRICRDSRRNGKIPISSHGRLAAYWKCPLVAESLHRLFQDWKLTNGLSEEPLENPHLSSIFIIIYCDNFGRGIKKENGKNGERLKRDLMNSLVELSKGTVLPVRGEVIEVTSTPFGNEAFLNSLSRGIVSNVVGSKKCMVLIDARTVPGCEGGPIFTCNKSRWSTSSRKLVGLITCPLSWWKGEWVGLTIGINLAPVLGHLFDRETTSLFLAKQPFTADASDLGSEMLGYEVEKLDRIVVLVQCGNIWGSGIVLTANTIITCSHVLKPGGTVSVFHNNSRYPAWVIYRTPDDVAYDLALIGVDKLPCSKVLEFSTELLEIGDDVLAVGYPFFTEKDEVDLRPTIVRGSVAKVHPHMIQSTCCVQSGFSGGALIKNGKIIGIIICNVKDSSSGALYPHVNFAIPSTAFQNTVSAYIKTNDINVLKFLESKDSHVQSLWSLGSSKL